MDITTRIRDSFARQGLMTTLGASLGSVAPGVVEIVLVPSPAISQQHGFVHAGAVSHPVRGAARPGGAPWPSAAGECTAHLPRTAECPGG